MKKAEYSDKNLVVDILSKSFDGNQSVNYIVKQDEKRAERLKVYIPVKLTTLFRGKLTT